MHHRIENIFSRLTTRFFQRTLDKAAPKPPNSLSLSNLIKNQFAWSRVQGYYLIAPSNDNANNMMIT